MDNEFLKAALKYHDFGWSVIPLSPGSKIPPKGFEVIQYRSRFSTKEEIEGWWKENPRYNIGVITGKLSNLFVVDLDKYKPEYKEETVLQYIPDDIETAIDKSPRGGEHLYFQYPVDCDPTIHADSLPAVDFRGEGGYILAPPSIVDNKSASWIISPNGKPLAHVPDAYLSYIKNNIIYGNVTKKEDVVTSCYINLNEGTRDQSLFHVANLLIKGGAKKEETLFILKSLAKQCNPPFPENEIVTKCNSAIDRAERKERNLSKELDAYIAVTNGYFSVTDCYTALQVVTKEDKGAVRIALSRLKDKVIEKHGIKDGVYKRIETNFDFINFDENEEPETEYPVKLPLGINDIAEISQGNIVLVAGEFNAGKTSFLLNVLKDNKGKLPIRYITSEMSKSEFKKRFASFAIPLSFWKQDDMTEYIKKSSDFYSVIKPEALNIIDYMEFRDSDYTKGAEYLTQIHDKLTTGIAIVAVQKKEGQRMPRSGDMIVEKPRLAISFFKSIMGSENPQGTCEILKCKMPKLGKIDGKKLRFEIQQRGSRFHVLNDWGFWKF
jgi:hypothetical protein